MYMYVINKYQLSATTISHRHNQTVLFCVNMQVHVQCTKFAHQFPTASYNVNLNQSGVVFAGAMP